VFAFSTGLPDFFLGGGAQQTKTVKDIPENHKIQNLHQMTKKYTKYI
jgi:hypothetical protein